MSDESPPETTPEPASVPVVAEERATANTYSVKLPKYGGPASECLRASSRRQ